MNKIFEFMILKWFKSELYHHNDALLKEMATVWYVVVFQNKTLCLLGQIMPIDGYFSFGGSFHDIITQSDLT